MINNFIRNKQENNLKTSILEEGSNKISKTQIW